MKGLISLLFFGVFFSIPAFATVDSWSEVYIVAQGLQEDGFKVLRVPFVGCYGIPCETQKQAFVSEHKLLNTGCGSDSYTNENLLSCANLEIKTDELGEKTNKAILDVSGCFKKGQSLAYLQDYAAQERAAQLKELRKAVYEALSKTLQIDWKKIRIIGAN